MSLITHARRIASDNPIYPYRWAAVYVGGSRLLQYDGDRRRSSRDIDRTRLDRLELFGHPASPLTIGCPQPPPPFASSP